MCTSVLYKNIICNIYTRLERIGGEWNVNLKNEYSDEL